MSYGPAPSQQEHWDWRAAGNFIGGGVGGGLIVFTALSGAHAPALTALLLAGLALIGAGLACVWFELGRPWRALHVFFNPRTSWMTREAFTATLLFPIGLIAAVYVPGYLWPAAVLAIVFVYCQSRMLQAAKGIPAWREPLFSPLIVVTGLVEGGGFFFLIGALHGAGNESLLLFFGVLVLARALVWLAYRRRVATRAAPRALVAIDVADRVLQIGGTWLPLVFITLAAVMTMSVGTRSVMIAVGGLLAWLAGAYLKYALITRAGFNQGFALAHLPVRGVRP